MRILSTILSFLNGLFKFGQGISTNKGKRIDLKGIEHSEKGNIRAIINTINELDEKRQLIEEFAEYYTFEQESGLSVDIQEGQVIIEVMDKDSLDHFVTQIEEINMKPLKERQKLRKKWKARKNKKKKK